MSYSTTSPHPTSIAVWDVPSPAVVNASFTVKVGMKCSAACALTGEQLVIRDESGIVVGEGRLGETPWPGTSALYAAEVTLRAPSGEGLHAWSVTFAAAVPEAPHDDASTTFSFRTARPPEHRFGVMVIDRDTQSPLANAQVRLGIYRGSTDEHGQTSLEVPKGEYQLDVRKVGYETLSKTVEVTADVAIQVEALCAPDSDPDDEQVWM